MMATLQAAPAGGLDETEYGFISTFMTHVSTLTGYGKTRLTTIARIKTLLLAAMSGDQGSTSPAWRALYRAIDDLLEGAFYAHDTRTAYAYLRAFIQENGDLA
jgi:hypothetical protein